MLSRLYRRALFASDCAFHVILVNQPNSLHILLLAGSAAALEVQMAVDL